jgi:hypothetical protein
MEKNPEKNKLERIRKICAQDPDAVLRMLFETPFWPSSLSIKEEYSRFDDDTRLGNISVQFSMDGDSWIQIISLKDPDEPLYSHRFRGYFGGGQSPNTEKALKFLAVAIKLDNENRPQFR